MLDDETNPLFKMRELIPFMGAIVTGAIGGYVASIHYAQSRREAFTAYLIAYAITGAFGGVMALSAVTVFYTDWIAGWGELFLITGIAGLVTTLALLAGNVSMHFVLKRIGLKVTLSVSRTKPKG